MYLLAVALAGGACTRSDRTEPVTGKSLPPTPGDGEARTDHTETNMPQGTPPANGDPWKHAEAIAAAHAGGRQLTKYRDELPYMFRARGMRGVLVHEGKVITGTGPAVAADYLRDIGIIEGPGPSIDAVDYLLFVLHAFPQVDDLREQSYYYAPAGGFEDLNPRIEREAGEARIVLHYMLPQDAIYRPDLQEQIAGAPAGGPEPRPVARLTLAIRPQGEATWQREDTTWTPPSP